MPIINQPQVAILGVGAIEKRAVVVDDAIAIRTMAYLTLGFDHRLIDGAVADQFMADVKRHLETVRRRGQASWMTPGDMTPTDSKSGGSGVVRYADALALQRASSRSAAPTAIGDLLLLLQHPAGDHARREGRRRPLEHRRHRRAPGRARASTCTRPAAAATSPITAPARSSAIPSSTCKPDRCDVHRYVRDLEDVMIRVCADYGLTAGRIKGLTGAWVGDGEDRRDRRPHLALDHEPRLRVQRQHGPRALPADRPVRHLRPRRDLARAGRPGATCRWPRPRTR